MTGETVKLDLDQLQIGFCDAHVLAAQKRVAELVGDLHAFISANLISLYPRLWVRHDPIKRKVTESRQYGRRRSGAQIVRRGPGS